MKKRLMMLLTVLCLVTVLSMPAWAADSVYLADRADLLSDTEEQALTELMEQTAADYDCGVYFVTVDSFTAYGSSPYDAATQLYVEQTMYGAVPADGILLMLSMGDRDYSLITYGKYAEAVYTDDAMWDMEDSFLYYFAQDRWYDGAVSYVNDAAALLQSYDSHMSSQYGEGYVSYYEPGVPDVVIRANRVQPELWLAVIGGSLVVALVAVLVMKAGMRTAKRATNANAYIPRGGVELRIKQDMFTHTTTHVIHHPKSNGGGGGSVRMGGGGGGFRGHSGKF